MSDEQGESREIEVRIRTVGGHEHELALPEDSAELHELFAAFVNRAAIAGQGRSNLVQLPLDGGKAACSIAVDQIVSIITSPPVLVHPEQPPAPPATQPVPAQPAPGQAPKLVRPDYLVIDDFLGVDEHADMLAYALRERGHFEPGTVEGNRTPGRRNSVIMSFVSSAHSTLLVNRLLVWFPLISQELKHEPFPLKSVESQLTASNDGDFYQFHLDSDGSSPDQRAIACVYYFFREPKGFSGGDLRVYDSLDYGGSLYRADSYQTVEPANNRLVVFNATTFHELRPIRCPSKHFEDSRFAVTNWIHRAATPDLAATFGWGHFHCGSVPRPFQVRRPRP